MTISVWRYSHLALAVSSCLFLLLAAVTGIILSVEPVKDRFPNHRSAAFDQLTLAQVVPALKESGTLSELSTLTVNSRDQVIIEGFNEDGDEQKLIIDPATGTILGKPVEQSPFFQWVTALHRSLFLHELGRFFIGLTAFLLLLITLSGTLLLIQRQRGIKHFLARIVKDGAAQYYHVVLGRFMLIPIILIALTGTYLSLVRFGWMGEFKAKHEIRIAEQIEQPATPPQSLQVFQQYPLSDIRSVEFPFSTDPEDYFLLKLKDRELAIDQYSGQILSEVKYPFTQLMTELSIDLHTGRSSVIWAVVLGIACINILYFMYSGTVITLKRMSGRIRNPFKADTARFIILVGTENGSTLRFAKAVHEQLLKKGERSYLGELNRYNKYPQAEHLLILTSTYGLGDAPVNAAKFPQLLAELQQDHPIHFSVVGFGSRAYPDFCRFAFFAYDSLLQQSWAQPLLDIHTVNDRSLEQFNQWFHRWSQKAGLPQLELPTSLQQPPANLQSFTVVEKSILTHEQGTFILKLKAPRTIRFTSGDLFNIYPANDHRERQYSIGKVNGLIQLSIRLHENGLGSGFLFALEPGQTIKARVEQHAAFHFPQRATQVVMIANGTGIAPFLGMISSNHKRAAIHLYAGFRSYQSFSIHEEELSLYERQGRLANRRIAFSREGGRQYVTNLIREDATLFIQALTNGSVIMLCGSLSMEKDVLALLDELCATHQIKSVKHYQSKGQIISDCY